MTMTKQKLTRQAASPPDGVLKYSCLKLEMTYHKKEPQQHCGVPKSAPTHFTSLSKWLSVKKREVYILYIT